MHYHFQCSSFHLVIFFLADIFLLPFTLLVLWICWRCSTDIDFCKFEKKLFPFFFFFGCAHSMWKFLGQGLNLHHSNDLRCFSDNTGSLAHCKRQLFFTFVFEKGFHWLYKYGSRCYSTVLSFASFLTRILLSPHLCSSIINMSFSCGCL